MADDGRGTFSTDSTKSSFLATAASLTCSSSAGKVIIDSTADTLAWCSSGGSTVKQAALGDDNGAATLSPLLAGRSGTGNDTTLSNSADGTIYGSTITAKSLILRANSADTTTGKIELDAPQVNLWKDFPSTIGASVPLLRSAPTATITGGNSYVMVEAAPVLSIADTSASTYFHAGGSVDRTGTLGSTLYQVTGFDLSTLFTSSTSAGPLFQDGFYSHVTVDQLSGTAIQNIYQPIDVLVKSTYKAEAGASLTIGQTTGVDINPTWGVSGGGTFTGTTFSAFKLHTPNKAGGTLSLPTYIGLDLEDLKISDVTDAIAIRSVGTTTSVRVAGPARFGAIGAPTSGKALDAQGDTYIGGYLDLGDNVADVSGSTTFGILDMQPTVDMSSSGAFYGIDFSPITAFSSNGTMAAFHYGPTVAGSGGAAIFSALLVDGTTTSTTNLFPTAFLLRHKRTYTTSTANGVPVFSLISLQDSPTISSTATSGTSTLGKHDAVQSDLQLTMNGSGGTMTLPDDIGLEIAGTYTNTAGTLNVTRRTGVKYSEVTTSGTVGLVDNIGYDVGPLTKGTGVVAGIRNASRTIYTPTTQAIAAATDTITCDTTIKKFTTFTGTNAMTSNPTIADGTTGQVCTLENVDATGTDCITLTDATKGMQLAGNDTLCPNDTITLFYDGTDWVELDRSDN